MNHTTQLTNQQLTVTKRPNNAVRSLTGGLPVRTGLRAGLAWDDLDDKAKALLNSLTSSVSNAVNTLTGGSNSGKPAA